MKARELGSAYYVSGEAERSGAGTKTVVEVDPGRGLSLMPRKSLLVMPRRRRKNLCQMSTSLQKLSQKLSTRSRLRKEPGFSGLRRI